MFHKIALGLASAGLLLGSTGASAMPINARDAAPVVEGEQFSFGGLGWLLGLVILAGVIVVVVADDDEDEPISP
jgi:hypothetical protein